MNTSNGVPVGPSTSSSKAKTHTTSASASANLPNGTSSSPNNPVIPLHEMLVRIETQQRKLSGHCLKMQLQLMEVDRWMVQHPHYLNCHHFLEIEISPTDPIRQYLQDEQTTSIEISELEAALANAFFKIETRTICGKYRSWRSRTR